MNRGIDHAAVFFADSDRIEFGQRLGDVFDRFGIRTHAYCLMDNHFHHLWHCPEGRMSDAMQRLGSLYTRHVNDRLGRDGALFRGRFHSRLITDEAHLVATVRYIHRNALDLDGIARVRDYRWSSHRAYLGLRTPPPWLCTDHVFAGWSAEAIDRFTEQPLASTALPSECGIERLVQAIEFVLAQRGISAERRLGAVARQVALAWFTENTGIPDSYLMEAFGIERIGTLRTAMSRARHLMRSEPELREVQTRTLALLTPVPITSRV
jgi:REP element-mobilizing transposase RayT